MDKIAGKAPCRQPSSHGYAANGERGGERNIFFMYLFCRTMAMIVGVLALANGAINCEFDVGVDHA